MAQLNHPNIASVFGFDQEGDIWFLVMERVEGEDLSARLRRGPLFIEEAIEVCKQIAEGLEAAHAKGGIHRDLKPANIKVSAGGRVKILDFGLAKALEVGRDSVEPPARRESQGQMESAVLTARQSLAPPDESLTITDAFTQPGTILGTAAYMSPEQAKDKAVDERADIWAFGCVRFENFSRYLLELNRAVK